MPIILAILAVCALGLLGQQIAHSDEIKGYKARLDEKGVEITRLQARIKALELERDELVTILGALEETVPRQDDTIRILLRRLAEKDDTIRILQRQLAEKQAELA